MKITILRKRIRPTLSIVVLLALSGVSAAQAPELLVNGERLNATMAHMKTFGGNENGGSDRVAYSEYNRVAISYLSSLMLESGLSPRIDVAGNLVGRKEGKVDGLAPIITGSHVDSVPNGGHYDGVVGSMAAIEVARTLHESGYQLDHPLEVIMWSNEEGGKIGSKSFRSPSMGSAIKEEEFELQSLGTRKLGEGIRYIGGDPDRIRENIRQPGDVAALIELHVEQGAILDREGISIGVVEGIVGIRRWTITVKGFANHAGTTPMDQRQDAMLAAARLTIAVNEVITSEEGSQVGTVGRIYAEPNTPNVVAGEVTMTLEIRDLSMAKVGRLFSVIEARAQEIAESSDTSITIEQYYESPEAASDERIMTLVKESADHLGLRSMYMPSGAGHDAQSLVGIAPLGMIFVPSVGGVSHAPTEFTSEEDITNGANVLLQTIIGIDKQIR